jgi:hypothetical protein
MFSYKASLRDQVTWPPPKGNLIFTSQAAVLRMVYHFIRILLYRPFISTSAGTSLSYSGNDPSFPYPAMEICVENARACAQIVRWLAQRRMSNVPTLMHIAHVSASMLLVKVWDLKAQEKILLAQGMEDFKPPVVQQIEPFMVDVNLLMHTLERAEPRWSFITPFLSV